MKFNIEINPSILDSTLRSIGVEEYDISLIQLLQKKIGSKKEVPIKSPIETIIGIGV